MDPVIKTFSPQVVVTNSENVTGIRLAVAVQVDAAVEVDVALEVEVAMEVTLVDVEVVVLPEPDIAMSAQ
jgi:hypothetical protein